MSEFTTVDAFNGDAVPIHLLTLEAIELYLRHLDPDGILAVAQKGNPMRTSGWPALERVSMNGKQHAVRLYAEAVQRGVKVRLMLPTARTSDFPIVQHASHFYYGPLLAAGATIYEYTRAGLHQKVLIIDREWCTIGSTNFDPRSFRINDEITVAIYDRAVAEELMTAFEDDVQHSEQWTLEQWETRSLWHRCIDRPRVLVKRQL